MKEIFDFIVKYWKYISVLLILIVEIIIFVIKKKPVKVIDSVKGFISAALPGLIELAESQFPAGGHGQEKFELVFNLLKELLQENGYEMTSTLNEFTCKQIENILSTPQKKGD